MNTQTRSSSHQRPTACMLYHHRQHLWVMPKVHDDLEVRDLWTQIFCRLLDQSFCNTPRFDQDVDALVATVTWSTNFTSQRKVCYHNIRILSVFHAWIGTSVAFFGNNDVGALHEINKTVPCILSVDSTVVQVVSSSRVTEYDRSWYINTKDPDLTITFSNYNINRFTALLLPATLNSQRLSILSQWHQSNNLSWNDQPISHHHSNRHQRFLFHLHQRRESTFSQHHLLKKLDRWVIPSKHQRCLRSQTLWNKSLQHIQLVRHTTLQVMRSRVQQRRS